MSQDAARTPLPRLHERAKLCWPALKLHLTTHASLQLEISGHAALLDTRWPRVHTSGLEWSCNASDLR